MKEVNKIDIVINDMKLSILPREHKVVKRNITSTITEDEIIYFYGLIATWKNEYYSKELFDGNHFSIKIHYDDKVDVITGIGALPDDYDEFYRFVRELYARR